MGRGESLSSARFAFPVSVVELSSSVHCFIVGMFSGHARGHQQSKQQGLQRVAIEVNQPVSASSGGDVSNAGTMSWCPVAMAGSWCIRGSFGCGRNSDTGTINNNIISPPSQFCIYNRELYSIELEASPICLLLLHFLLGATVTDPFQ